MIPLKSSHPTLGLIVNDHCDLQNTVEFTDIEVGTAAHNRMKNWKRRLRGTVITKINGDTITSTKQMKEVIKKWYKDPKTTMARIEFGSMKGFAINGIGIPALQVDQLNVIAHHVNKIQMEENGNVDISDLKDDDTWNDPTEWPDDIRKEKLKVSRLTRRKIMKDYDEETKRLFREQEWKQLNQYHKVGMFGEPIHRSEVDYFKILGWV